MVLLGRTTRGSQNAQVEELYRSRVVESNQRTITRRYASRCSRDLEDWTLLISEDPAHRRRSPSIKRRPRSTGDGGAAPSGSVAGCIWLASHQQSDRARSGIWAMRGMARAPAAPMSRKPMGDERSRPGDDVNQHDAGARFLMKRRRRLRTNLPVSTTICGTSELEQPWEAARKGSGALAAGAPASPHRTFSPGSPPHRSSALSSPMVQLLQQPCRSCRPGALVTALIALGAVFPQRLADDLIESRRAR